MKTPKLITFLIRLAVVSVFCKDPPLAQAQNPPSGIGSMFSPDGQYDIGKATDQRPGYINAAKGLQIGQGSTFTPANGAVNLGDATVTQATSLVTGVTMNAASGVITTVTATTGALAVQSFTLTNSAIAAGSVVQAFIQNYSGTYFTNGTPYVTVGTVAAGSCTINVLNLHTANALAGVLKIGVTVE